MSDEPPKYTGAQPFTVPLAEEQRIMDAAALTTRTPLASARPSRRDGFRAADLPSPRWTVSKSESSPPNPWRLSP